MPYLSFCYLHSLRSPIIIIIINARAGGAYLNLFSFRQPCIWFRSVVVMTCQLLIGPVKWFAWTDDQKWKVASSSLAETIFLIFNFSFSSLESKNYVRKTYMCFVFLGKDPTGKKFFVK